MSEGLGVYYCDNEDSLTWLGLINDLGLYRWGTQLTRIINLILIG